MDYLFGLQLAVVLVALLGHALSILRTRLRRS